MTDTDKQIELKPQRYYLMKKGYYYRPGARGYSACTCEAGTFSEEEIKSYIDDRDSEVTAKPVGNTRHADPVLVEAFEAINVKAANVFDTTREGLLSRLDAIERITINALASIKGGENG